MAWESSHHYVQSNVNHLESSQYQNANGQGKTHTKTYMTGLRTFYNEEEQLCLERDLWGVGLGTASRKYGLQNIMKNHHNPQPAKQWHKRETHKQIHR